MKSLIIIGLLFFIASCDNSNCGFQGVLIPMPDNDSLSFGEYIENSLMLGWSPNEEEIYYLKELYPGGFGGYRVSLFSQNVTTDKINIVKEYISNEEFNTGDASFWNIREFLEKNNKELEEILINEGIEPCMSGLIKSNEITLENNLNWKISINNTNIGDSENFTSKVKVNKPNGSTKTIYNLTRNEYNLLSDLKFIGHFISPKKNKSVILTYAKEQGFEGDVVYSPYYTGCALDGKIEKRKKEEEIENENVVENTLTKNGKKLLKVSALRSLYLGGDWYNLENKLGEPDEEYRLGTSMFSSNVYYNSAIDDYYGKPQHIAVMVSPQGIITQIWNCKPGKKLQISYNESISTPK